MHSTLFEKLQKSLASRKEIYLITVIVHPNKQLIGKKALLWRNGEFFSDSPLPTSLTKSIIENDVLKRRKRSGTYSFTVNEKLIEYFAEFIPVPPHLIVAGAGHVCEPVATIGKMVGFFVTVIDDRAEFANINRFPTVDEVICKPFVPFFKDVEITKETYILLLTRGHKYDVLSLQELIKREEKPAYIGMIGSRRRIAGVFEELKLDFPNEILDYLYTPVGLDIGAETPSEIAVSIMAEILKIKNEKSGDSLCNKVKKLAQLGFREGVVR